MLDIKALHVLQISLRAQRKRQQREQQTEQGVNSGRMSAKQDNSEHHASRLDGKV
jgi:hypothetical protein